MIEQRRDLRRRCNTIEHEIREALSIQDMGDVEAMLDAADRPELEAEQVELRAPDRGSGSARTRVVYGIQQSVRRGGSRRRR
ncbi:hypothetical protein MES5069_310029 [Mesorhizobium escarrei]|uniref:Uncharacterized protein n=1 Tax=Mesorhizobium escarrei TaxID=666018 RepID=A0ABM9DZR5_9HYPH|nr:hypothetical protein MES5069_310029 [Mesorhizobium escarrei]